MLCIQTKLPYYHKQRKHLELLDGNYRMFLVVMTEKFIILSTENYKWKDKYIYIYIVISILACHNKSRQIPIITLSNNLTHFLLDK